MNKYCFCEGCRYSDSHTTSYHKCGKCNSFGHGRIECPLNNNKNYYKQNNLISFIYNKNYPKVLPKENWCKIADCNIRQTHTTMSHNEFFSKDKFADLEGPDKYGIRQQSDEAHSKGYSLVKNINNSFTNIWWGMGNYIFTRNINGKIEQKVIDCNSNKEIYEFTKNLKEIQE